MKKLRFLIIADDSPCSIKAIRYGYVLAHRVKAKVALLGVIDSSLTKGSVDAGIFPKEAILLQKNTTREFLGKMASDYSNGTETEIFTPVGGIKETVLNMAKEWEADLIISGTHQRKGLNRLLIGSVTESILRDSKVPTLVVPPERP